MRSTAHLLRRAVICAVFVSCVSALAAQAPAARLLVVLRDASMLGIFDAATKRELGRVPTVKDPHEVAVSGDGRYAYVGSPSEGIAVIDLAAQKEIRRINPGARSSPHDVLFAGGKLYFTAEGFKTIGRYDPVTETIEWMLGIGQNGTHLMVMSKDQNTMFVPNRGSNSVSIIDAVSAGPPKFQTTAIPVQGKMPEGLDLSPDGRELWTATRGDGGVSIVDVMSRKVAQTVPLEMKDANRLKFTPDGRYVLILDGGTGTLVVVDAAARKAVKRIKLVPNDSGDGGMMVAQDGSRVYLGLRTAHTLAIVDLKSLEVTDRIATGPGSGPGAVAWVP